MKQMNYLNSTSDSELCIKYALFYCRHIDYYKFSFEHSMCDSKNSIILSEALPKLQVVHFYARFIHYLISILSLEKFLLCSLVQFSSNRSHGFNTRKTI